MTTNDISTIVHAHACVCEGTAYRFTIRWIAAEELADPALARVLVQAHAIVATESSQPARCHAARHSSVTAACADPPAADRCSASASCN